MIMAVRIENVNKPFQKIMSAIFNRVAGPEWIGSQNILVRRGLGWEPQQAENHQPPVRES